MATNKKSGFLSGLGYLGEKIGAGFMQSVEGIWDFAAGGLADVFGADEWAERQMSTDWFGNWYSTAGDWFDAKGGWKTAGDVASGIGTTLPAIVTAVGGGVATALSGGTAAPLAVKAIAVSIAPLTAGLGAAGTSTKEAYQKTGELTGKEYGYGALSGTLEAGIEAVTGGLGTGSARIAKSVFKGATKTAAQEAAEAVAKKTVKDVAWKAAKRVGADFVSEGFEEGLTELASPYLQRMTYDPSAENATAEEIAYAALVGGLAGSIVGTAGGAVGAGASAIMDAKIGKDAIEAGQAEEILSVAAQISKQVESGEAGYEVLAAVDTVYKQLAGTVSAPADIATLPQKAQLGKLKKLLSVTRILPDVENSAKVILANPEAVVARYNELGITDENGNAITAEKLTEGIETDASGRATILSLRKALSNNRVLGTLAVADAMGKLMVDHNTYVENATAGGYLGGRAQYQNFVENASPEQKAAMAQLVGAENLDAVDYETFAKRMIEYGNSPEGSAKIRSARDIRKTAENIPENEKAVPPAVSAAMKDGAHRFGGKEGIAIFKNGDTVRIYDYETRNTTRELTIEEASAELRKARRAADEGSSEKTAKRTKVPTKKRSGVAGSDGKRYAIKYPTYAESDIQENMDALADMDAVAFIEASKLERSGKTPKEMFAEYFASLGNSIYSEEFGDIALGNSSVKSEIRHGLTAEKIASMEAIPSVIEQGKVIFFESKMDGDDRVKRIVVAAPIKIGDASYYMGVMLQRDPSTQYLYLHNVAIEKEMTAEARAHLVTTGADAQSNHLSMTSILQKAVDVKLQKQKISSKQKSGTQNLTTDEIAAFAKENVPGYGNLLPAEQREIRAMIRQGKALGVPDADIKTYATVSARSGIRVAFSKERTVYTKEDGTRGYADGFYDPVKNEIVVNPEGTRSPGKLLMHELSHALYYYKKYRTVLDKATQRMDEARAKGIVADYKAAGESAAVISEELLVHHAEDVLGSKANLERVVAAEPNIKSKILSFFRVAKSAYQGDERLSLNAGRLYKHFERAFNDFAARNRGNLAAETVTRTNPENTQVSGDGKRYAAEDGGAETATIREQLKLGSARLNEMEPVASVEWKPVEKRVAKEKAKEAFRKIGYQVDRQGFGVIQIGVDEVERSSNYLQSNEEYAAWLAVPRILKRGIQLDGHKDHKKRSYKTVSFAAPITINGTRVNVCVIVKQTGKNRYSAHRVLLQDGSEFKLGKQKNAEPTVAGVKSENRRQGPAIGSASTISIPDSSEKINPSDENSSRRKALPDTTEAVGKTKKQYEPSKKEIFFTAKDRAYIETVDELYGIEKYLHKVGGTAKAAVEADVQLARAARSQAQTMIGSAQYNVFSDKPEKMGDGLLEIYKPTRLWSAEKRKRFDDYLLHCLNIDRMTLESRSKVWTANERAAIQKVKLDIDTLNARQKTLRADIKKGDTAIVNARVKKGTAKTAAAKANWQTKVDALIKQRATDIADLKKTERDIKKKIAELKKLKKELKALELKNKPVFGKDETLDETGNMKRDHDITAAESKKIVADYEKSNPEFKEISKKLYTYLDNLQTMRVEAGLITREQADYMKKLYPHYVPSYRDTEGGGVSIVKGKNNLEISTTVKKAKGGNQDILEVASSIAQQTSELMKAGQINILAGAIYDAAKESGDNTYVEIISEEDIESDDNGDAILRPKQGQVTFHRDGKRITMQVSREILLGFEGLRNPSVDFSNPLMQAFAKMNTLFKRGVTSLNPAFMLRNPIRDLQDAGLNSKHPILFSKALASAAKDIATNSKEWELYRALGGFSSTVFEGTLATQGGRRGFESIAALFDTDAEGFAKVWDKAKATAKSPITAIENANAFLEQITRFAEFKASLDAGDSPSVALNNAAEVTTNFGRRGRTAKTLNATLMPFLNPAIQGFDKIFRNVGDAFTSGQWVRGLATLLTKAALIGVVPMLLNSIMYDDDEDYEKLRETDKENYFLIKIGDGNFIKIPRGRLASVIGGAYNRSAKLANGEDADIKGYLKNAKTQVTPVENISRTIFSPIFDVMNNKTWYGGEIEGREWDDTAPRDRYDESTSSIAVTIGQVLNVSPKKVHYLLDQYSGVIGDFLLPATTQKEHKGFFSGNFTLDSVTSNKLSEKFYDLVEQTQYAKTAGDADAAYRLDYLNRVKKSVKTMNEEIDSIRNSDKVNAEKMQEVRIIRALINAEYDSALKSIDVLNAAITETAEIEDEVIRSAEIDRLVFGTETALKNYNAKTYEKYQLFNGVGIGYDELYVFHFATLGLENDTDKKGNVIEGSKKKKILAVINALNIPREQKLMLLAAKGYAPKDGDIRGISAASAKRILLSYIMRQKITKAEKAELARACGFTVKGGVIVNK